MTDFEKALNEMVAYVEGGVAESLEDICEHHGLSYNTLTQEELVELDGYLFTCEACDWTHSVDDLAEEQDSICYQCYEDRRWMS